MNAKRCKNLYNKNFNKHIEVKTHKEHKSYTSKDDEM
jgi:hypothetical protein